MRFSNFVEKAAKLDSQDPGYQNPWSIIQVFLTPWGS
jgi:hypothetical protein